MAESTGWRLRLLGEFGLEYDGRIVDRFGTRKEELVLAYVALAAHTPLVREAVAASFWPDDAPSLARKNLSYNLSVLRSRFAAHGVDSPFSDSRSTARLADSLRVDVEDFSEWMLAASIAPVGPERVELLEQALALYGGGLLPTYGYDWLKPHQARFAAMYKQAVALLSTTLQPGAAQMAIMSHLPPGTWRAAGLHHLPPTASGRTFVHVAEDPAGRVGDAAPGPGGDDVPAERDTEGAIDAPLMALSAEAEAGLRGEDWAHWVDVLRPYIDALDATSAADPQAYAMRDECQVRARVWRYWQRIGRPSNGYLRLHHLLVTAHDLPLSTRAKALYAAGSLAFFAGETARAAEQLQASVQMWRHVDDPRGLLGSLINLGLTHHRLGALSAARDCYGQALGIARAIGDDGGVSIALFNAALAAIDEHQTERARGLLEQRRELCPKDAPSAALAAVEAHLALADLIDDRSGDARVHAQAALEAALAVGDHERASHAHRLLGTCACRDDDWAAAEREFARAVAEGHTAKCYRETGASLGYLAICQRMLGRIEQSEETLFQALGLLKASGDISEVERFMTDLRHLFPSEPLFGALSAA
ncbi:MAG: hypothetical protein ABI780_03560 [Ardenticatenales bacterium]